MYFDHPLVLGLWNNNNLWPCCLSREALCFKPYYYLKLQISPLSGMYKSTWLKALTEFTIASLEKESTSFSAKSIQINKTSYELADNKLCITDNKACWLQM